MFEDTKISKLDIKRIYRYLDKNVHKDVSALKKVGDDVENEFEIEDDDGEDECE